MIALRDVTKTFGARVAVDHVSLALEPGTTRILLGSSGSGKSTILRLVLGLLAPDTGEILVDDVVVSRGTRRDALRRMGYVVQDGALYPHMTAAENATLAARAEGWPRAWPASPSWSVSSGACSTIIRRSSAAASDSAPVSSARSCSTRPCFCSTSP